MEDCLNLEDSITDVISVFWFTVHTPGNWKPFGTHFGRKLQTVIIFIFRNRKLPSPEWKRFCAPKKTTKVSVYIIANKKMNPVPKLETRGLTKKHGLRKRWNKFHVSDEKKTSLKNHSTSKHQTNIWKTIEHTVLTKKNRQN